MWPAATITLLIVLVYGFEAAPLAPCPKSCICSGTEYYCKSFHAVQQLSPSVKTALTKLVINNNTACRNPNLVSLVNLKSLNLASNKLRELSIAAFPKSLEYLDLSQNSIRNLPRNLYGALTHLKELNLSGNPISCTCDAISLRDQLLQNNVKITNTVKCDSPENVRGKSWLLVTCADGIFGEMQGDAPYEGSGFEEAITESENRDEDKSLEDEFIRVDSTTKPATLPVINEDDEGSGDVTTTPLIIVEDEDINDSEEEAPDTELPAVKVNDLLLNNVKACFFDCSTPAPTANDTDELPPPSVFEGVKIVLDDFNVLRGSDSSTTTTESPYINASAESNKNVSKITDAETLTNFTGGEAKENITQNPKESNSSTYIFLGGILIIIIALIIYAVFKKRTRTVQIHSPTGVVNKPDSPEGVELLKATKPSNGTQEGATLTNGHTDIDAAPYEDVELRQTPNEDEEEHDNLLIPEAKRVTIKASEIPNSTPKTPILVTRHVNSDGSVVTTPAVHHKM